jgi:hypothetical protein
MIWNKAVCAQFNRALLLACCVEWSVRVRGRMKNLCVRTPRGVSLYQHDMAGKLPIIVGSDPDRFQSTIRLSMCVCIDLNIQQVFASSLRRLHFCLNVTSYL